MQQKDRQLSETGKNLPSLSVVICTHNTENYPVLEEAIESLLKQSHKITEIIVVVDGNQILERMISNAYALQENIRVFITPTSSGVAQARNAGIRAATQDIVAFIDDDAVADEKWAACLVDTYQKMEAIAVGGKVLPLWLSGKSDCLPEELYWLVGVTHEGFAEEKVTEVLNTWGPNMSFARQVFEIVGYFNETLGFAKRGTSYIQAEEPEFSLRMKSKLGRGVVYNPEAIVYHRIPSYKLKLRLLLKRSFFQGYSKALVRKLTASPESLIVEKSYLRYLIVKTIPARIKKIVSGIRPLTEVRQIIVLLLCIVAVGLGFVYGYVRLKWTSELQRVKL